MVGWLKTRYGDKLSATICNQVLFSEVEVEPTQTINEVRMSNAFHMQREGYHSAEKRNKSCHLWRHISLIDLNSSTFQSCHTTIMFAPQSVYNKKEEFFLFSTIFEATMLDRRFVLDCKNWALIFHERPIGFLLAACAARWLHYAGILRNIYTQYVSSGTP